MRIDRKGWQIHEFDSENGMYCYLKIDTYDYDETVETFLEGVGFYGGDA
ncbi:hypothetical protein HYG81_19600 (plasmid) [Natrinema zhouii]|nr:hypothetical protein [Natrinema zhouii]UHQ98281.1 hypothetical protein HYG81_19600 [Natrinema zhouii]